MNIAEKNDTVWKLHMTSADTKNILLGSKTFCWDQKS